MSRRDTKFVALLRGINVGGHKKILMSELRSLCANIGWDGVQSYIQSGNLVFSASARPATLENDLENAIERHFGFAVPVLVRTAEEWASYVKGNPFPNASLSEAKLVMLVLSKAVPQASAVTRLRERASADERVVQVGDVLWIHFGGGAAKSKLSPAILDRLIGSPATTRNWRTVLKLEELAGSLTGAA